LSNCNTGTINWQYTLRTGHKTWADVAVQSRQLILCQMFLVHCIIHGRDNVPRKELLYTSYRKYKYLTGV